jgi:hypothetical protein
MGTLGSNVQVISRIVPVFSVVIGWQHNNVIFNMALLQAPSTLILHRGSILRIVSSPCALFWTKASSVNNSAVWQLIRRR